MNDGAYRKGRQLPGFCTVSRLTLQGCDSAAMLHRRMLIYTPGHPFIRSALKAVVRNVLGNFTAHKSECIITMTGPTAYFFDGVAPVLRRNGCGRVCPCWFGAAVLIEIGPVSIFCRDLRIDQVMHDDGLKCGALPRSWV